MKFTKILGVVAAAALALMAFASTASATTLEVKGVKQTGAVTITAVLEEGTSALLTDTFNSFANTCKKSHVEGTTTTPFTATRVGGPLSWLTFEECTEDAKEHVTVDKAGYLEVENIAGTTNGTVFSKEAEVTTPSPFGKLTCKTGTGVDVGKITGVGTTGMATMDVNAVLNCSVITAKWTGSYTVTSPESGLLGVTS